MSDSSDSDDQQQIEQVKTVQLAKKNKKTKLIKGNNKGKKQNIPKITPPQNNDSDSAMASDDEEKKESIIPFDKPAKLKNVTTESIIELKSKQLHLLYPVKLPKKQQAVEDLLKPLNERIVGVRMPRQKTSRWCLLDFADENDRNKALQELKKVDVNGKKLVVNLPKLQNEKFLAKVAEKRQEKREKLKEKKKLKRLASKQVLEKTYTSTVVVTKIPSSATSADIKNLIPEAVDMRFTLAQGMNKTSVAYITLPSPHDATKIKNKKLEIDGDVLEINFAKEPPNANLKKRKFKNSESDAGIVKKIKTEDDDTKLIKPKEKKNKAKKLKGKSKIEKPATGAIKLETGPKPTDKVKPVEGEKQKFGKNKIKQIKLKTTEKQNKDTVKIAPVAQQNGKAKLNKMKKAKPTEKSTKPVNKKLNVIVKNENGASTKKAKPNNKQKKTVA